MLLVSSELVFFTQTNHGERRGYFWQLMVMYNVVCRIKYHCNVDFNPFLWSWEWVNIREEMMLNYFYYESFLYCSHLVSIWIEKICHGSVALLWHNTKFHQNRMKNKTVLLIASFSVQNFKVSVELWKSYIVQKKKCQFI